MSLKNSFFRGMVSGGGAYAVKAVCNIFLIPLLIRFLGTESYGLYVFLIGMAEMLLMVDVGLTTGLIQRLTYYRARDNTIGLTSQLGTAKLLYSLLSVALLAGGWVLTAKIPIWLHWSAKLMSSGRVALLLIIVEAALNLNNNYYQAILKSHFLYDKTNLIEVFQALVNTLSAVLILWFGFDFVYIFICRIWVSIAASICLRIICFRADGYVKNAKMQFSPNAMKDLFGISFFAMVQRVSVFIAHRIDDFVIAFFLNLASVGMYSMVLRVFGQISGFCIRLLDGLLPVFTHISSLDEIEKSRAFLLRASAFMSIVAGSMILFVLLNYPEIIHFLSDGKVSVLSTFSIAIMMAMMSWSGAVQIPASNYLFSSGLHRFQTYSSLVTALINLGLSIFLVRKIGIVGVAMGTLIPHFIQHQFITVFLACRKLGISLESGISTIYVKPVLSLLVGIMPLVICRQIIGWHTNNLYLMSLASMITVPCIVLSWLIFCASLSEKKIIWKQLIINPLLRMRLLCLQKKVEAGINIGISLKR